MELSISPELRAEIGNHRRQNNIDIDYGYLNSGDDSNDPRVRDGSGRMWVSIQTAEGYTKPVALPVDTNANITPQNNVSVEIGYHNGEQTILKASRRGLLAAGTNPNITNPLDPDVKGGIQTYDIGQFRCRRSADIAKPWTVVVENGYLELEGVAYIFIESEIDLSGLVPAAGEKNIACVYIKTDLTLEAFASTSVLPEDPITSEMINECRQQADPASMSVWGWVLEGDLSGLTEDPNKNIDLRDEPPAATSGTDTDAVHVNAPAEINGITAKATPISGDVLLIEDSADSYNKKSITIGDLPGGGSGTPVTIQAEILLGEDTLGSAAASIDIDLTTDARYSSCKDLKIRGLFRVTATGTSGFGYLSLRPNGATNNTGILMARGYADAGTSAADQYTFAAEVSSGDSPSGAFSLVEMTIPDFNSSTLLKIVKVDISTRILSGAGANKIRRTMAMIDLGITAPIADLTFIATDTAGANSGTLDTGSTVRITSTYEVDVLT